MKRRNFVQIAGGMLAFSAFPVAARTARARVLILGDSISMGYTPHVKDLLKDVADVTRPDENCQGTTHGIANITKWLGDGQWDVIHFNFGLHDIKHVDPVTRENSNKDGDPPQADLKAYTRNLTAITKQLRATGAKLIFATTTPFPDKPDGPVRRFEDVLRYNKSALKIMKKNGVVINDLYSFALPRMQALQIPNNVHFTKEGSAVLAEEVARVIRQHLKV